MVAIHSDSLRRSSASIFRPFSDLTSTSSVTSNINSSGLLAGVDGEVAQMFHDLQHISEQIAANDRGKLVGDRLEHMESICAAEKNIDLLIHDRIEQVDTNEHRREFAATVLEKGNTIPTGACARSATIFVYLFLRRVPTHSPVFDWMVKLMQQDFERTEKCIRDFYPPELLFWMLFVAGTVSLAMPERSWFRKKLVEYRDILRLHSWYSAKLVLEKLAWLETPGESLGGFLWEELENLY